MTKSSFLYGIHTITAVLENNPQRVRQLFVQEGRRDPRTQVLIDLAEKHDISVQIASHRSLDHWTAQAVHQGIVAQVVPYAPGTEAELEPFLENITTPIFLLVLDGLQDPHNLGACLRTANAAGVHGVIIPKDKSASLTPTVHKVASGAIEMTAIFLVTNLSRVLRNLQARGIWVYGLSDDAEKSLYQEKLQGNIALVLGAEGEGLRRLTREHCDQLLRIPMQGTVSSLNVSVATGICVFEAVRQRGAA